MVPVPELKPRYGYPLRYQQYGTGTYNNGEADGADSEESQRDDIPMDSQPARHPAQQEDPKKEKGAHVEESVALVPQRGLGLPGDDEELPGVKEHRVHLHHEGEGRVGHVLPAGGGYGEAEDDQEVVDEQLVRGAFPMVEQHVQGVVDEISDGEGDEGVGGGVEGVDQVLAHTGGLHTEICRYTLLLWLRDVYTVGN